MILFDPSPIACSIPFIGLSITWYGLCFASGLIAASYVASSKLKKLYPSTPKVLIQSFIDSAALYATLSLLIGARLFEALFYSPHILQNPWNFIAVWEGGLASHGGIAGLGVGCLLFYYNNQTHPLFKEQKLHPLCAADIVSLSAILCGAFIRLGNFINQEIVGTISNLPWAITFMHPREFVEVAPRHPAQLYEAIGYGLLFLLQNRRFNQKNKSKLTPGVFTLDSLIGVFLIRFFVEYVKAPVISSDAGNFLSTGQLLSLPFLILAISCRFWLIQKTAK